MFRNNLSQSTSNRTVALGIIEGLHAVDGKINQKKLGQVTHALPQLSLSLGVHPLFLSRQPMKNPWESLGCKTKQRPIVKQILALSSLLIDLFFATRRD